jgi:tyrosine-protein kinase Etk/Wzc
MEGMAGRAETSEREQLGVPLEERGVDLFDILFILSQDRRRIAAITLISIIIGVALSFWIQPTFTATALILPPQEGQSVSSMMGQLGALVSLGGGGGLKTPADLYIGILQSRTIADDIIAKYRLQEAYKAGKLETARIELKSNSRFMTAKDGLIHIMVEDHDPNRASELANAYVDELYAMNSHLAITEAAQRRVFFDQELADEKNALTAAENALKQDAEKTGVIQLSGQAESMIRSIAETKAEIASREVEIQSLRTFATDQNPEAVRVQEEINALRGQLAKMESDPRNPQSGSEDFPAGQVPEVSLEYARKLREVRYHETLFDLLSKQYEAARIDEAKAAPIIQVVDRAVPPQGKTAPKRTLITLAFAAFGFFAGCVVSFAAHTLRRMEQVPEYALKLARLRSTFPFGR